jgi:hypothetical protein
MRFFKRLFREPVLHFILLGALLFAYFQWTGGSGPGSRRIVVTPGLVQHFAAGFYRTWQRPATPAEIKGLIDDHVKEEIATREAMAMGLDRDDAVIRRRLRQKLEFLTEDEATQEPPTEVELQAWLDAHPKSFARDPQVSFRQVYLSTARGGAAAEAKAAKLLARLRAAGPTADTRTLGDRTLLPAEEALTPLFDIARDFGEDFTVALDTLATNCWIGPVASPFGLHLVYIRERVPGFRPTLTEARPLVEREVSSERRKKKLDDQYQQLLRKYEVVIDLPTDLENDSTVAGGAK